MALPDIPNAHALAVLLLTVLALFLFTREKIPLESSSLFVLVARIIGFERLPVAGPFGAVSATFRPGTTPASRSVSAVRCVAASSWA